MRPLVAARVKNSKTGKGEEVYALVDSGANRDYLSTELAERLGLEIVYSPLNLKTATESSTAIRPMSEVILESLDGEYTAMVADILIGDFPCKDSSMAPGKKDWSNYKHLKDIHFADLEAEVELIISSGHPEATIWTDISKPETDDEDEERREDTNLSQAKKGRKAGKRLRRQPVATKNVFGWTVQGPDGEKGGGQASISALSAEDEVLRDQLQSIFDRDFPPCPDGMNNLARKLIIE